MATTESTRLRFRRARRRTHTVRRRVGTRISGSVGVRRTSLAPARGDAGPAAPIYHALPGLRVALRPRAYLVFMEGIDPPVGPIRCVANRGCEWGLQLAICLPDLSLLRDLLTGKVEIEMLIPVPTRTGGALAPATLAGPEVYARGEALWAEAFEHPGAPCRLGVRFTELDPDAEELLLPFLREARIPPPGAR